MFLFGRITLEKQLAALAAMDVRMNSGVSISDFLISFPRDDFERKPYDLILFSLGSEIESEPWGRHISDDAWNFDLECVDGPGSYRRIIENLLRIAKRPTLVEDIIDDIRPDATAGELRYTLNGQSQSLEVEVIHDWADGLTVAILMGEIADATGDGRRFRDADNGQANILFFLADDQVAKMNRLANNKLKPMAP